MRCRTNWTRFLLNDFVSLTLSELSVTCRLLNNTIIIEQNVKKKFPLRLETLLSYFTRTHFHWTVLFFLVVRWKLLFKGLLRQPLHFYRTQLCKMFSCISLLNWHCTAVQDCELTFLFPLQFCSMNTQIGAQLPVVFLGCTADMRPYWA